MSIIGMFKDAFNRLVHAHRDESERSSPMTVEERDRQLDAAAAATGECLDWRGSFTDLQKAIGLPSDRDYRAEVAKEAGIENYTGTAEQNMRAHAFVLDELLKGFLDIPQPQ